MNTENDPNNELEALRAEVAALQAQVSHDNETRQQLLSASERLLPALTHQQEQWEKRHAAHLEALRRAPELERLREEGLLPKFAVLASRQRALEEQFAELSDLGIETYSSLKEVLELLRRDIE